MVSFAMLSIIMLDVTYKPFVLSVVMVSVAMLSVIMLNVTYKPFVLSVIMLNAVIPLCHPTRPQCANDNTIR